MTPYTREKYFAAVLGIAVSNKPPAERLADAWVYHLMNAQDQDNPARVQEQFEKLKSYFSEIESEELGSALASARSWSEQKTSEVAEAFAAIALWDEE